MDTLVSRELCAYAQAVHREELDLLRTLGRIPAPSHHEDERAAFVAAWLRDNGAQCVSVDAAKNVICQLGDPDAPRLLAFAAHTDIVFDDTEPLPMEERDGKLYAPGIGDDTANLVGLLMATRYLLHHPDVLPPDMGVLVVANSCEEGLGNLDGTKAVFQAFGHRIKEFVSFDLYMPQCINTAVGSHRFRITAQTRGGHSYHDFGQPNAIVELASLVCDLYALETPDDTITFNVGRIEGGTTVNSIASQASMLYEYRSTSDESLATMRILLERAVADHVREGVSFHVEELGVRPGNGPVDQQALTHLTDRNLRVMRTVTGLEPDCSPASTDANIPLSLGIPANTVGAVTGALLHTREEWIDEQSLVDGLQVILGMMLAALEDYASAS